MKYSFLSSIHFVTLISYPFNFNTTWGHHAYPAGTERCPNQSWTNIISVQGRTNPEPILNQSYGLIRSATIRLWFTYVRTHPFTFWFSRTDPESKMPAGYCSKMFYKWPCHDPEPNPLVIEVSENNDNHIRYTHHVVGSAAVLDKEE